MYRLQNKTALVTGAARGLGAAIVRRFVDEGAFVVAADVLDDDTARLVAECHGRAEGQHLDVRDAGRWCEVVASTQATHGAVDVLVNNAGVIAWGGLSDTDEATFRRVLDVNTMGVFLGMQSVVDAMRRAGGGSIVNISSAAGMIGSPGAIGYTASKWAVRGMTKAAALELAPFAIRVNSVHPGVIRTPMSDGAGERTTGTPPLGRVGEPDEVALLVVYLASDESRYTTGTEHVIDGGQLAGAR
jgi:3alpha(or 20beta)-hydroxysteroid dehydrogenase